MSAGRGSIRQARKETILQDKLRALLKDFSRALSAAIADSSEIEESLRRLRSSGYALYLLVDCKRSAQDAVEPLTVTTAPGDVQRAGSNLPARLPEGATARLAAAGREPRFQINGNDLQFLRSIGIDPTRRLRTRRRRST